MKVPSLIRTAFDRFPLVTLPAHMELPPPDSEAVLIVYSVDENGLPYDPKCLAIAALLRKKGLQTRVQVGSPYISSLETLPLLISDSEKSVHSTLDHILNLHYKEEAQDSTLTVYRSLIETWINDAWFETVMSATHQTTRSLIYNDGKSAGNTSQFPWPFSSIQEAQLDAHLEERFTKARVGFHDTYVCDEANLLRAGLSINALSEIISSEVKEPTVLDILIFAYIWPITQLLPDSALAALVTPKLRDHARNVHQYLTR